MSLDAIIEQCSINTHPETVKAIIRVESGGNPLAIGVNYGGGRAQRPRSQDEAIQIANSLIASGKNIDMGLMQINSANLRRLGLTTETIFDPCTNIRAGTQILSVNYANAVRAHGRTEAALKAALSTYNTGNMTRGFRNGYVARYYKNSQSRGSMSEPIGAGALIREVESGQSIPNGGTTADKQPLNPLTADTSVYKRYLD